LLKGISIATARIGRIQRARNRVITRESQVFSPSFFCKAVFQPELSGNTQGIECYHSLTVTKRWLTSDMLIVACDWTYRMRAGIIGWGCSLWERPVQRSRGNDRHYCLLL